MFDDEDQDDELKETDLDEIFIETSEEELTTSEGESKDEENSDD